MRILSSAALSSALARETGEAWIVLLSLWHSTLPTPILISSDGVDTISRGGTYQHFPFEIDMPPESDQAAPECRLRVCNVDLSMTTALRNAARTGKPIQVTMEVCLASSPDTIEAGPFSFALRRAKYNELWLEGSLVYEDLLAEPFPGHQFSPSGYPGLFQ